MIDKKKVYKHFREPNWIYGRSNYLGSHPSHATEKGVLENNKELHIIFSNLEQAQKKYLEACFGGR